LRNREQDISKKYGKGTWAVVTAASDEIGAEYARQLAKSGFNIVLLSETLFELKSMKRII
jgi:17beta-estradiol 17-dehydrogenase / very-long-chain 3-oxoacyl-CoA reductase